uniref:Aminoglycoside phosphotransferase domain-containing protein n=1 Tax=Bionectria ochroleuca TaxID=29856 RepID=A0A8H7NPB7_BIOOC
MPPVTSQMLDVRREKNCVGITLDRKYFHVNRSFVKRSLRPSEWQINPVTGTVCVPRFGNERLLNESASMQFIAKNTNLPVPKLFACFEDDDAVCLVTEYIEGESMAKLPEEKRKVVEKEIEGHLETLRSLTSDIWGGPSGIVIPPYRVMVKAYRAQWKMKRRESKDLVFLS